MTQEEILNGNRVIALFMGLRPKMESPDIYTYSDMPYISIREYSAEKVMDGIVSYAKYHSSWDWLMPVVQHINILDNNRYTIQIMSMDVYIHDNVKGGVIFQSEMKHQPDELINSVYEAVIEFIKWYNGK
jgi:hypothetical protein